MNQVRTCFDECLRLMGLVIKYTRYVENGGERLSYIKFREVATAWLVASQLARAKCKLNFDASPFKLVN